MRPLRRCIADCRDLNWQNLQHMVCLLSCMPEERRKTVHVWRKVWVLWWRETPACHHVSYRLVVMWTATHSQGMWHHAVRSNRFWILSEGSSETERTHKRSWTWERTALWVGLESRSRLNKDMDGYVYNNPAIISLIQEAEKPPNQSTITTKSTFSTVERYVRAIGCPLLVNGSMKFPSNKRAGCEVSNDRVFSDNYGSL